jgi:hypothetical protein
MTKKSSILPTSRTALLAVLAALFASVPAYCADVAKPQCSGTNYKILSPNQIIIECQGLKTSSIPPEGGKVFLGTDLSTQLPVTFTTASYVSASYDVSDWLLLTFTPIPATLRLLLLSRLRRPIGFPSVLLPMRQALSSRH